MLDNSTIYILSDFNRLEQKSKIQTFRNDLCNYETVVFKSTKGDFGFISNNVGQEFLSEYLLGSIFWNNREETFVDFNCREDIEKNILKLNGLSIFTCKESIENDKNKVKNIKLAISKNAIYKRVGRALVEVESSPFLNYFKDGRLDIYSLKKLHNVYNDIVMWDWGEFGLYFHVLSDDIETLNIKIKTIASNMGLNVVSVKDSYEVPSW